MNFIIYIAALLVYLTLYTLKINGFYLPLISDYLADLLCLPLILGWCRFMLIRLKLVTSAFELSVAKIVFAVVAFSIVFEWILPKYSPRYTADILDVFAYIAGAVLYYLIRKKDKTSRYEFQH